MKPKKFGLKLAKSFTAYSLKELPEEMPYLNGGTRLARGLRVVETLF